MPLERLPFRFDLAEIAVKAEHDFLSLALWHGGHSPSATQLVKGFPQGRTAIRSIKSIKSEQMVLSK
jgi:hypothetical protein